MHPATLRSVIAAQRAAVVARNVQRVRGYAVPATIQPREKDPQLGDYPQLPDVSRANLPPTGWWDNQMRRNYGDILHEQDELYSMWGPDPPTMPPHVALFQFTLAVLAFAGIAYTAKLLTPERESIPREYPFSGLVKELGGLEANKANVEKEDVDDE